MPDIITLGEALIDFVALEAGVSLIDAAEFAKAAGGAPANVACGAAGLGIDAAFIGKVGDDPFGHFLERTFREAGADTSRMIFSEEAKTGLAFVALGPGMVPDFTFYRNPSADMLLDEKEIDESFIESAKVFHYGSISLISDPSRTATRKAADIARNAGLVVSYDPNLRLSLWSGLKAAKVGMLDGLQHADMLKVSAEELEFLTEIADFERGASELLGRCENLALILVTMGGEGCFYMNREATGSVCGFTANVVDTTGAGDGFVAGVLSQIVTRKIDRSELRTLGGQVRQVLLVGCEPETSGSEEDMPMGLSGPVQAAVPEAVGLVESLVAKILSHGGEPAAK
jgi:fructokinase